MDKREILSNIISKTIVFICVVLFVVLFKTIFGNENTLIGVTNLILALVFLLNDFTGRPIRNLVIIIGGNIALGIGTFIIGQNLYVGLVLNFIFMFLIGYVFTYELKKPLNMLVGLHYILMLTNQVTIDQLPKRLIALVCGGILIMAAQMIVNKNKLNKLSQKMIKDIQKNILIKINLIIENKNTDEVTFAIDEAIHTFKMTIFQSEKKGARMEEYAKFLTNKVSCMERINILLDNINDKSIYILSDIAIKFEKLLEGTLSHEEVDLILSRYDNVEAINNDVIELVNTLKMLVIQKEKMKYLLEDNTYDLQEQIDRDEELKNLYLSNKKITLKSNRIAYALRLGLLVSISTFVVAFFNLTYGQWLTYTVFALTQPYKEFSNLKSKKRIQGTLIGALAIGIIFSFIKDPMMRTLTVVGAGYMMSYVSDYKNTVALVTINSIASACINIPDANPVIINRLIFVGMGIAVAAIANKYILPWTYEQEEQKLQQLQTKITEIITTEVIEKKDYNDKYIQNLYLIHALIENRIKVVGLNVKEEFLYKHKTSLNNMHQTYLENVNM